MSSLIGRKVGAYQIEKKIGEGGNSDVYLAHDTAHNRQVALKVLRLEHHTDRKKVERFWRSGHSARALEHPHIVRVYDAGMADTRYYIAMDYMEGRSIEDLLGEYRGALPWTTSVHYLHQIAEAIDYAHRHGVIHRDIKPSNILLSADRQDAYLTDFGIALLTGQETLTDHGSLIGTPEYISPEQVRGETADPRSDIYSLGVTAYQMMSGALPFDGPPAAVLYNHVHTPPPSVRRANRGLPGGFAKPIQRALAKEPARRYPTALAFVADLQRAADGRRPGWPVWVGLVAALLAGLWLVFSMISGGEEPPATVLPTRLPPTLNPTAVVEPTREPTSTIRPTPAPTSTTRLTATVGATRTREPATPSVTATPAPPRPPSAGISLLAPPDGADIPQGDAVQTFRWEWSRALAEDESFELRFYPAGSDTFDAPFGWRKETSAEINLGNLPRGAYTWVVAVVRGQDGIWEEDIIVSEPYELEWGR